MSVTSATDRFFGITERGSTFLTEVKGGVLVFFSMVYIIAVNAGMMVDAGVPSDSAITATIVMAVIGSILMGVYARFPAALAPGMSINAMVCYTVVLGMGFSWQEALVGVVLSGAIFFAITASGLRRRLLNRIPSGLKSGIVAGIGCFIAFVGLSNARIIVGGNTLLVGLGDVSDPTVMMAIFCIIVTLLLYAFKPSVGILIGLIVTLLVGVFAGIIDVPESIFSMPAPPPFLEFIDGIGPGLLSSEFAVAVVSIVFVELFDGSGTLLGIASRGGIADGSGNMISDKPLIVDSGIASLSGIVGSTPATAFAESTVGIEAGARTGMMSLVVALLFLSALFIAPVFGMIGYSCTVGAMVVVGLSMSTELMRIDWKDKAIAAGAITTVVMMVLSYSITNGLALGILVYCLVMIGSGRWRDVSWALYLLAVVLAGYLLIYTTSF